jgi:hypothetical protein
MLWLIALYAVRRYRLAPRASTSLLVGSEQVIDIIWVYLGPLMTAEALLSQPARSLATG